MTRLARFQFKTDLAVRQLSTVAREVLSGPHLAEIFLEYLIALHCIIRASEPLLQAASEEARRRLQQGDQSCAGLPEYFARHQEEEHDHAEWLLQDIEAMGLSRDVALSRQPSMEIAALAGSQYYWIYHYHPGFLLGYLAVLEGYPLDQKQIDFFKQQTGYPEAVFRTLRKHAELDPAHGEDLYHFLEQSALTDRVFEGLSTSSLATCSYLSQILRALVLK